MQNLANITLNVQDSKLLNQIMQILLVDTVEKIWAIYRNFRVEPS